MYVCKRDVLKEYLCLFFLVTKNVKSSSKIAIFFFEWAPFWNLISKKKKKKKKENNCIFQKKNILATQKTQCYIFPKTRETRTSSGPIWVPLILPSKKKRIRTNNFCFRILYTCKHCFIKLKFNIRCNQFCSLHVTVEWIIVCLSFT